MRGERVLVAGLVPVQPSLLTQHNNRLSLCWFRPIESSSPAPLTTTGHLVKEMPSYQSLMIIIVSKFFISIFVPEMPVQSVYS